MDGYLHAGSFGVHCSEDPNIDIMMKNRCVCVCVFKNE